ncbi:hypothetical protein EBQ91_00010 [bacterium]|nr:hypothetical protein [bacterium]
MNVSLLGNHLYNIIKSHSIGYFISLQYSLYDDNGINKEKKTKLYDISEVRRTHKIIKNFFMEAFSRDLSMFFFIERNKSFNIDDVTFIGHYHSHILLETIQDYHIEEPTSFLRRVMNKDGLIPISNRVYDDIEDKKIDCIEAVLNRCEWLQGYNDAINIQPITNLKNLLTKEDEDDEDGGYLLKQIGKNNDIDKVIDYNNSSY